MNSRQESHQRQNDTVKVSRLCWQKPPQFFPTCFLCRVGWEAQREHLAYGGKARRAGLACASQVVHATNIPCRVGAGAGGTSAPGGWCGGCHTLHMHCASPLTPTARWWLKCRIASPRCPCHQPPLPGGGWGGAQHPPQAGGVEGAAPPHGQNTLAGGGKVAGATPCTPHPILRSGRSA